MRTYLAGILLIGTLAGCSSDWDPARTGHSGDMKSARADEAITPSSALSARGDATSFASLPDRGELLRYSSEREVKRMGAYTLHPVEISEDHALNAIATGELKLNTPDGKPVSIKYDSLEEHPDGNWSWVGQNSSGEHAVLTFGDQAVFGEVFAGGRSYRVAMRDGRAWMVETDRTLLAGSRHGQRDDGPDFLIPPDMSASFETSVETAGVSVSAAAVPLVSTKSAGIVDIAIGYTNGMVTTYGSQAAALTRISSMVALTNAAYQRSGVNMRVRLVRAVQVNFTDTSDNDDALQKMTGYNATSRQFFTPDPAFSDLRAARDEYGADLVALVRPYRAPEQNGCGIAWLIGAGERSIDPATDAQFGYSVVSEGGDIDEGDGNTYFCSDYSLAHELGHNMGQAHNRSDARDRGRHAYSYGYREASTSGFFTLMAYPIANGSQNEIPYFATPLLNYAAGRPMGTAAEADNVRSMNLTMPVIAQFRATKVPLDGLSAPNDFDGDGRSDLLWRNDTTGGHVIWKAGNHLTKQAVGSLLISGWDIHGVGDFNGNGKSDILFRNSVTGQNRIWSNADSQASSDIRSVSGSWIVAGIGDFNGDGRADILWRNPSTGGNVIWLSADGTKHQAVRSVVGSHWVVAGVGDFNGDGVDDILWRNLSTGGNVIWRSADSTKVSAVSSMNVNAWVLGGVADFNGDGVADLFFRNTVNGGNIVWPSAKSEDAYSAGSTGLTWQIAAIGDFNKDGRSDVMWRNPSAGSNVIWWSGNPVTRSTLGAVSSNWRVIK